MQTYSLIRFAGCLAAFGILSACYKWWLIPTIDPHHVTVPLSWGQSIALIVIAVACSCAVARRWKE
ncbi:MAG: hypothetical protein KBD47_00495 [Candidatus Pacebacteria bacterium]|nr:hypothetical protein [Candidatus Paceibacterota bacterium]